MTELEIQLQLIAAQAASLASAARHGAWESELSQGLRVIREALDKAGREVSNQRGGSR